MFLANSSPTSNEWNVPPFCSHYQNNSTSSPGLLQSSSQILKHLCDFSLTNVDLGLQSFQCSKIRSAQHWGRRVAHLGANKGVKSECKKFGENSRQMAPVSAICDEYWRLKVQLSGNFAARLTSFFTYGKMLPRSTIVGYDELCLGFFFPFLSPLNNTMNAVPLSN